MANQPGVVLTAGDFQALAVLRSMRRQGVPVVVVDHEHGICRYSRFKQRVYKAPPLPKTEPMPHS
jgi:predicted ATP-grasp superfamily ATP-dependent carboligase